MSEIFEPTQVCYRAFELIGSGDLDSAEKLVANCLTKVDDDVVARGLFHTVLGLISKMRGKFKEAYQHYHRAETLIPDDPAVTLIVARLLIEQFAEYDAAIKKAKKVLGHVSHNAVFQHQAYTTMGLAYLKKGDRTKTADMLTKSMAGEFATFVSAKNIDFHLVEAMVKKNWSPELCRTFLEKAALFAKNVNEWELAEKMNAMIDQWSAAS